MDGWISQNERRDICIIIKEKEERRESKKNQSPRRPDATPISPGQGEIRARAGTSSYSLSVLQVKPEGAFEKHLPVAGFERLSSR